MQLRPIEKAALILAGLVIAAAAADLQPDHPPAAAPTTQTAATVPRKVRGVYYTCEITMAQFQRLTAGMSYGQVKNILGCPGELVVDDNIAGYHGTIYGWNGAGSIGANMIVQFQNDAMISKSQFGLRW